MLFIVSFIAILAPSAGLNIIVIISIYIAAIVSANKNITIIIPNTFPSLFVFSIFDIEYTSETNIIGTTQQ